MKLVVAFNVLGKARFIRTDISSRIAVPSVQDFVNVIIDVFDFVE